MIRLEWKNFYWLSLSLVVIGLDQWSKYLVMMHLVLYQPYPVTDFLNLTLLYNTGAAFSLFNQASGWQHWVLGGVAVAISVVILVWLLNLSRQRYLGAFALSLILGGALGNLLDRIFRGFVVDFLDFYFQSYHWFVFNVADAAITVGAIALSIDLLRQGHAAKK